MYNKATFLTQSATLIETLTCLLEKCNSISQLKQTHALLTTFGLSQNDPFISHILSLTATSHFADLHYSQTIFLQIPNPAIFNWNTIIRGYSKSKTPSKSVKMFVHMLRIGVVPDHLTYPFIAKACARMTDVKIGSGLHGYVAKSGFSFDGFVRNSLIHMYATCGEIKGARDLFDEMPNKNRVSWNSMLDGYAKCRDLDSAREVFETMPERDVISWSSLIDGYVKGGKYTEALAIFENMRVKGPRANEVTMVSVLCACAHLGALEYGKLMHRHMKENGLPMTLVLRTSLVDMYAKSGAIKEAMVVFREVSTKQTDVLIWNAIIGGLANHGYVTESLNMFKEMQILGISPDEVTYLCLLSACAHGGLVNEAWYFLDCLNKNGMTPESEHYACMIDVLARAGHVTNAYNFLCRIPIQPTASMLGALFNGCVNHGKLDLAEIVGRKLVELEPDHDGRYVGLSNVYAVIKRWDKARTTREAMEKKGVKKFPGFSFVEVLGNVHRFIAHDKSHPRSEEIYKVLRVIVRDMILDDVIEIAECEGYADLFFMRRGDHQRNSSTV